MFQEYELRSLKVVLSLFISRISKAVLSRLVITQKLWIVGVTKNRQSASVGSHLCLPLTPLASSLRVSARRCQSVWRFAFIFIRPHHFVATPESHATLPQKTCRIPCTRFLYPQCRITLWIRYDIIFCIFCYALAQHFITLCLKCIQPRGSRNR